jgi:hypothetical protein
VAVPKGIRRDHVLEAIARLGTQQTTPPFKRPTAYWLVYRNRRYAPKAVLGLARQVAQGGPLLDDFQGGVGASAANTILGRLGFTIEQFRDLSRNRRAPGSTPNRRTTQALTGSGSQSSTTGFWWVNQGQAYSAQRAGGFLWAPTANASGQHFGHWDAMTHLAPGDVVFHYAGGVIRAVGTIVARAVDSSKPPGLPSVWHQDGRRAPVDMIDLDTPIDLARIPLAMRRADQGGPFDRNGEVKQAYLFPLSTDLANRVVGLISGAENLDKGQRRGTAPRRTRARGERRRSAALGLEYRDVDEAVGAAPKDPFRVDPDRVDRGIKGHKRTQNALARWVRRNGMKPLRPAGIANYDLAWWDGAALYVAEVKSLTNANETQQVRLGLGQVLDYEQLLAAAGDEVRPVLALELEPKSDRWLSLCARVGVVLTWPSAFEALDNSRRGAASARADGRRRS